MPAVLEVLYDSIQEGSRPNNGNMGDFDVTKKGQLQPTLSRRKLAQSAHGGFE